jgi:hypothetical protein
MTMVNQNDKRCLNVPAPDKWIWPQTVGMGKDNKLLQMGRARCVEGMCCVVGRLRPGSQERRDYGRKLLKDKSNIRG